jgi:aspartate aminotransferase
MYFIEKTSTHRTKKFHEAVAARKQKGLPIMSLGQGEPDFNPPESIKESIIEVLRTVKIGYTDPMGILSLREKLVDKLRKDNNIKCSSNNLIITAGSKQAFYLVCLALLEPGDEAIVVNPSYISYLPEIHIAEPNCNIIQIDINKSDFNLPLQEIESSITQKTKILVINSPNNPTGYVLDNLTLKYLFCLAEKYGFYIISDEIYDKLVFSNIECISVGSFEALPTRVITINGFSKSHAMAGWGLGYACFPDKFFSKLRFLQLHINSNANSILQLAIDKAIDFDQSFHEEYNNKLTKRVETIRKVLLGTRNVSLILPKAGFFAFMNISGTGLDSDTFCGNLVEKTGVATTPGKSFGESWDDHIRISFATSEDVLSEGMELISEFINHL